MTTAPTASLNPEQTTALHRPVASQPTQDNPGHEQQIVLRVLDEKLAQKLREILREQQTLSGHINITFKDNREGELTFEGSTYPVRVLDLPTVVEAYKTYDDIHLVKAGDVGQILLVGKKGSVLPAGPESENGVTPPMNKARRRHFKPLPKVDPAIVKQVEDALLQILSGRAPDGCEFLDIEEEYVVDKETKQGSWQPVGQRR